MAAASRVSHSLLTVLLFIFTVGRTDHTDFLVISLLRINLNLKSDGGFWTVDFIHVLQFKVTCQTSFVSYKIILEHRMTGLITTLKCI